MKKIRIMSLAMVLLLLGGLVSCSSAPAEPTEPDVSVNDPAESPSVEQEDVPAAENEPVEKPGEIEVGDSLKLPGVPEAVGAVPDVVLPLTEEEVTFDFWVPSQQKMVEYGYTDADEWQVFREMKERTGVNVEFELPSDPSTQFGIMMASGDLPDLIEGFKRYYRYGMDHAIEEELILALERYKDILPHIFAVIESSKEIHNQCYTDNGHMPGIPYFKIGEDGKNEGAWAGYAIRQDWLDELSLQVPTTYSELEKVLEAFQTNYESASHPLMIQCYGGNFIMGSGTLFHAGYNITGDWIQENGTVMYSPLTERYKAYVTMMTDWYNKGYLNADHISNVTMFMDPGTSMLDESGVFPMVYLNVDQLYETNADRPAYRLTPLPTMKIDDATDIHVGYVTDYANVETAITVDCENPEILLKYWDYLYSNEGILLSNYGVEGVTFEFDESGQPRWIQAAFKTEEGEWALDRYQYINLLYNTSCYTIFSREYVTCSDKAMDTLAAWNTGWDTAYNYPASATMTAEDSEAYGATMNDISTYVTEMLGKFILGAESLDNWDTFIQGLYDMGIEDCIAYKQAALDRYNAR